LALYYYKHNDVDGRQFLQFDSYKHVNAWLARINARPAFVVGAKVNGFRADSINERHSRDDTAAAYAALKAQL
jgi:uncharacterized membrane protein